LACQTGSTAAEVGKVWTDMAGFPWVVMMDKE